MNNNGLEIVHQLHTLSDPFSTKCFIVLKLRFEKQGVHVLHAICKTTMIVIIKNIFFLIPHCWDGIGENTDVEC